MPDTDKTEHYHVTERIRSTILNTPSPPINDSRTPRAALTNAHPKVQCYAANTVAWNTAETQQRTQSAQRQRLRSHGLPTLWGASFVYYDEPFQDTTHRGPPCSTAAEPSLTSLPTALTV